MVNSSGNTEFYDAWQGEAHARMFGVWDQASMGKLLNFCGQFNDFEIYRKIARDPDCRTLLDVGCATGRFYRYFHKTWPNVEYTGIDISESAIARASTTYPSANFKTFDGDLKTVGKLKSDVVFCRDVILHQTDPRKFLADLYDLSDRYLVLRMRTKETGETVFEPSESCQYTNGSWVPYIVFNRSELTDMISSYSPTPKSIDVVLNPMVLGGRSGRYLPKDLYDPEAGGSETSLLIDKGTGSTAPGETAVSVKSSIEATGRERASWARLLARVARKLGA